MPGIQIAADGAHPRRERHRRRPGLAREHHGHPATGTSRQREEWWRRFQWATDLVLEADDPQRANVGVLIIRALLDSPLAATDELNAAGAVLDEVIGLGENGNDEDEEVSGGGIGEGNGAGAGAQ